MPPAMQSPLNSDPPCGYHGGYRWVDVSNGQSRWAELPADVLRRFLGGAGLGTYLLLHHNAAAQDALHPQSPLAFVFSPLVGSPLTTSAKFAVVSKSPLTERINDSLASSGFAMAGKRSGCDALLITGRAARPSVLLVDEQRAWLEPAGDLWGRTCGDAESRLKEKYGSQFATAVIGPAGERCVRYATVSHDGRHAGRGGSGAVLGSKNLKAVLVRGNRRPRWAHPQSLAEYARRLSARSFGPETEKYRELGTTANLLVFNRLKTLPTRNFQAAQFSGAAELAPEDWGQVREKTRASCVACTIGCEHIYALDGDASKQQGVRLEYENLFALGPLCGIGDPDVVLKASKRCDELGMDTISAGGTIAFAMECAERGWLDAPWLRFEDGAALARALEMIARREGLGELLAEGSRRMAQQIGHGSLAIAPQVKGLELPGYEPRGLQTMALGFAVGARGADHNRSGAYEVDFSDHADRRHLTPDSALLAVETENRAAIMDSLILCKFLRGVFDDFYGEAAEMLRLVTGWDVTADELQQTARRIVTAKKLFNIRAGWTPDEDVLPARFFDALQDDQQAHLTREQLAAAVAAYNRGRGWTDQGHVPRQTLIELDLSE